MIHEDAIKNGVRAEYESHVQKARGKGYTPMTWAEYLEDQHDIVLYPNGWEGRPVYHTMAKCPVILLDEPRAEMVKVMYIHPHNNYAYEQFHQGYYDVKSLTDWSEG